VKNPTVVQPLYNRRKTDEKSFSNRLTTRKIPNFGCATVEFPNNHQPQK